MDASTRQQIREFLTDAFRAFVSACIAAAWLALLAFAAFTLLADPARERAEPTPTGSTTSIAEHVAD